MDGGPAMAMEDVQRSDEEFMGVLLLVTGQVAGVRPDQVQQPVQSQRCFVSRVKLAKFENRNVVNTLRRMSFYCIIQRNQRYLID